jgi:DNA helicase-2/ATP-dependent DNA helicase PcrA
MIQSIGESKTTVVLGAAGCGKTTRLLNMVDDALASGVKPNRIGFISFTKRAIEEGRSRASERFGLPPEDFPHFRTIHSWAFRHLGMRRDQVLGWRHLNELGRMLGLEFKGKSQSLDDGDAYGMAMPDRMLFLEGLARNSMRPLEKVWSDAMEDDLSLLELDRFARALKKYKDCQQLLDFTDMVEVFTRSDPRTMPPLDLLLVDESADNSALQWRAVSLLATNAKKVVVCGDDMQSIFSWSGADVQQFISLPGRQETLEQSYRLPRSVHKLAETVVDRVKNKRPRCSHPRQTEGSVNYYSSLDDVDMSSGDWLCLARNGYMLKEIEDRCLSEGFSFNSVSRDPLKSPSLAAIRTWENLRRGRDESAELTLAALLLISVQLCPLALIKQLRSSEPGRLYGMPELRSLGLGTAAVWFEALSKISPSERDYFRAVRRRGEPLLKKPRIQVSTIHASKGSEGSNVLLLTDVSRRSYENANNRSRREYEDEQRVLYVALTRAKEALHIVQPRTNLAFDI